MRKILPHSALRTIYLFLFHPHFATAAELYATATLITLNKLIVLNNKLLRILQFKPRLASTRSAYLDYNVLPIKSLANYKMLLLIHKWYYNFDTLPESFHGLFQKSVNVYTHRTTV